MKKSTLILILAVLLCANCASIYIYADANSYTELTIDKAVKIGIKNSIVLKQVINEIELSAVADDRANYLKRKLEKGNDNLKNASRDGIEAAEELTQLANSGLANVPVQITLPNGTTIPAGTPLDDNTKNSLKDAVEDINNKIQEGKEGLASALKDAGAILSSELSFSSLDSLDVKSTGDLSTTMSNISLEVKKASYDIYENQIAILIQKSYYDALKYQKMLEVKRNSLDRAKKQYDFANESFKAGMRAKDDMLLANVYYTGAEIEYNKTQADLNNAILELKRNMNISLDTDIRVSNVDAEKIEAVDLTKGLLSGMRNRLEIKQAYGEVAIYDLNLNVTAQKYPSNTYQYQEAEFLKEKARINFNKTKVDVECSIRQSYETLKATGEMLNLSKQMVEQARESVEIAEYRYKEGIGIDSSLLQKLDLQSSGGTILEVLAAEENLSQVEEKVVEITYGYNLAKMKYLNDAGILVY